MIKLQQLISERIVTKDLRVEEGKELLTTKYRYAFWLFYKEIQFWRGHRSHTNNNYYEVYPSKGERESVDSANIYTVLLGHLPSWNGWPKRSHALIMSNSSHAASDYGNNLMMVFPENDAKIVVSSMQDVLSDYAFPFMKENYNIGISDIANLDDVLGLLMKNDIYYNIPGYAKGASSITAGEYNQLISDLNRYTNVNKIAKALKSAKDIEQNGPGWSSRQKSSTKILKAFVETRRLHGWDWEKFLSHILDPEKNQFELTPLKDFKGGGYEGSYEMWTDADCLLVTEGMRHELKLIADQFFAESTDSTGIKHMKLH